MIRIKKNAQPIRTVPDKILDTDRQDYMNLNDIARACAASAQAKDVIKNWLRTSSTLEFLGLWEALYNPGFKADEFDQLKRDAGLYTFAPSVKEWIQKTNAIGMYVRPGPNGGIYAHIDIAFEFGCALNPVIKLYWLREYQRLHKTEINQNKTESCAKQFLKNTPATRKGLFKGCVAPQRVDTQNLEWLDAVDETELLNAALFGFTSEAWGKANPEFAKQNIILDFASIAELTVLANLEICNAELIKENVGRQDRFKRLHEIAQYQLHVLAEAKTINFMRTGIRICNDAAPGSIDPYSPAPLFPLRYPDKNETSG